MQAEGGWVKPIRTNLNEKVRNYPSKSFTYFLLICTYRRVTSQVCSWRRTGSAVLAKWHFSTSPLSAALAGGEKSSITDTSGEVIAEVDLYGKRNSITGVGDGVRVMDWMIKSVIWISQISHKGLSKGRYLDIFATLGCLEPYFKMYYPRSDVSSDYNQRFK